MYWEHKDKHSDSGYSHDGIYAIQSKARMKCPKTGEWLDAVIYMDIDTSRVYVREESDFYNKFKKVNNESKD